MRVYNITDYGALESNATVWIQKAIDACFQDGGGVVEIPSGVWNLGSIRLRSGITLHLLEDAVLNGSRNPDDYCILHEDALEPVPEEQMTEAVWTPASQRTNIDFCVKYGSRWNHAIIRALYAENIGIIGEKGSMICGNNCYDENGEEHYRGPHGITFSSCKNITLKGYVTKDTGNWAHNIQDSENIQIQNVICLAGHDGVHFTDCKNITVCDCEFYTGDDCVAGISNLNVYVDHCIMNTACSALRFGGTNVIVRNSRIFGPARYLFRGSLTREEKIQGTENRDVTTHRYNMLSAFTYYSDFTRTIPVQPSHILMEDCEIDHADRLVHYNFSGNEPWQKNKPLADITLRNLKVQGLGMPLNLYGDSECPIHFTAINVSIAIREDFTSNALIHLCHYDQIRFKNVSVEGDLKYLIKRWSEDGDIDTSGVTCQVEKPIEKADEPFFAKAI